MNLFKYLALVKAVETGSITRAAEALNYSQSGISRMIGDLEREWGVTLLERGRSGVALTSDGLRLLPMLKSLCCEYEQLQAGVEELKGLQSGIIRIGTISSVATHWLPNVIKAFQRDFPGIDYELLLGDYKEIEGWILSGRVDCGFLRPPVPEGIIAKELEKDELVAVLPIGHPLLELERIPPAELCRYPFMQLERGGRAEAAEVFEGLDVQPNIQFTTWDDYAVMSMVEVGLGVSILPELIMRRVPYRIEIRGLEPAAYRTIALALPERRTPSTVMSRFMDYLDFRDTGTFSG